MGDDRLSNNCIQMYVIITLTLNIIAKKIKFFLVHRLLLFNFLQYENCAQTYIRLNYLKIISISHYFLARIFSTSDDCVLRHMLVPGSPVLLAALGVEMLGGRQGTNDHRWHQGSHCRP